MFGILSPKISGKQNKTNKKGKLLFLTLLSFGSTF